MASICRFPGCSGPYLFRRRHVSCLAGRQRLRTSTQANLLPSVALQVMRSFRRQVLLRPALRLKFPPHSSFRFGRHSDPSPAFSLRFRFPLSGLVAAATYLRLRLRFRPPLSHSSFRPRLSPFPRRPPCHAVVAKREGGSASLPHS
jgi:hypothetical protein